MGRAPVRAALFSLGRNLAAGLRLALFMPVERTAFRISAGQLLLVVAVSAAIDIDADWLRAASDARFSLLGLHAEIFALGLLALSSALIAIACREAALYLALPIVVLASFPVIQVIHVLPELPQSNPAVSDAARRFLQYAVYVWMVLLSMRAVYVCVDPQRRHRRACGAAGGVLLTLPIWFAPLLGPLDPWWRDSGATNTVGDSVNAASEPVLAAQDFLMDHALDALDDERAGVSDLYFVGFAPDARHFGFMADVDAAQRTMDEMWDTRGRSLVLVNNPATVASRPFATVTHLRSTLLEIGDVINPDEDVVMVYLAGSGTNAPSLSAINPPLDLVPLSPQGLRQLLDAAGIRWRIVVVSTCYAGAWIDALKDDETAVIASSPADVHANDCDGGATATSFGDAFFGTAMRHGGNIAAAFDAARSRQAQRGAPKPVLWMGPAIAQQLKALGRDGPTSGIVANATVAMRTH